MSVYCTPHFQGKGKFIVPQSNKYFEPLMSYVIPQTPTLLSHQFNLFLPLDFSLTPG